MFKRTIIGEYSFTDCKAFTYSRDHTKTQIKVPVLSNDYKRLDLDLTKQGKIPYLTHFIEPIPDSLYVYLKINVDGIPTFNGELVNVRTKLVEMTFQDETPSCLYLRSMERDIEFINTNEERISTIEKELKLLKEENQSFKD